MKNYLCFYVKGVLITNLDGQKYISVKMLVFDGYVFLLLFQEVN